MRLQFSLSQITVDLTGRNGRHDARPNEFVGEFSPGPLINRPPRLTCRFTGHGHPPEDGLARSDREMKEEEPAKPKPTKKIPDDTISRLHREMEDAAQLEDYQRAAMIRDEIRRLEKEAEVRRRREENG